jgi:hypothetical protein
MDPGITVLIFVIFLGPLKALFGTVNIILFDGHLTLPWPEDGHCQALILLKHQVSSSMAGKPQH